VVVAVTFLALLIAAGVRSTPGVLLMPLESEFGWDRTTTSVALSINLVLYGLTGPFVAAIMDRYGIRRIMVIALCLLVSGMALSSLLQHSWQLNLLWGIVIGLGTGSMANVLGAMVANRWFVERRGLVVGLMTASGATGQLLFLPLLAKITVSAGWRSTVLTVACGALLLIPIVLLFMRNHPRDVGLTPYGATEEGEGAATATPPVSGGPSGNLLLAPLRVLVTAAKRPAFWLLAGTFFFCGFTTNGLIGTHMISACLEHGIPEVQAAGMLAFMGVFDLVGTTLSGWLSDRWDNRWLLFWYYALRGLSLMFLPYALDANGISLVVFSVFYGLDWIATVPPTVRLTADIFGKENVGMVFGWISASHQLGAATAAYGAGLLHTIFNDYVVAFLVAGGTGVLAAFLALAIRTTKPAKKRPA
jgi:MFS family permease